MGDRGEPRVVVRPEIGADGRNPGSGRALARLLDRDGTRARATRRRPPPIVGATRTAKPRAHNKRREKRDRADPRVGAQARNRRRRHAGAQDAGSERAHATQRRTTRIAARSLARIVTSRRDRHERGGRSRALAEKEPPLRGPHENRRRRRAGRRLHDGLRPIKLCAGNTSCKFPRSRATSVRARVLQRLGYQVVGRRQTCCRG
jgi:hypothetical protein